MKTPVARVGLGLTRKCSDLEIYNCNCRLSTSACVCLTICTTSPATHLVKGRGVKEAEKKNLICRKTHIANVIVKTYREVARLPLSLRRVGPANKQGREDTKLELSTRTPRSCKWKTSRTNVKRCWAYVGRPPPPPGIPPAVSL